MNTMENLRAMTESLTPTSHPNFRAGMIHGLDIASQSLFKFACQIKDDDTKGHSERKAIINVLHEIHREFEAEMEKVNGNANQSPRVD
jgi:hypothetical protein